MSVVSVKEIHSGRSTTKTVMNSSLTSISRRHTRKFRVVVDNQAIHDTTEVIDAFGIPVYGDTYLGPGGQVDLNVKLVEKSAESEDEEGYTFIVTCDYEDITAVLTQNIEFGMSTRYYERPFIQSWQDPGGGYVKTKKVLNSANDPYIPPLTEHLPLGVYKFVRYLALSEAAAIAHALAYNGKTNSDVFKGMAAETVRCTITMDRVIVASTELYRFIYEMEFNPETWRQKPIQQGFRYKKDIGGGNFKWIEHGPNAQKPSSPFLLTNTGEKLDNGDDPDYGDHIEYEPVPFAPLGL